MDAQRVGNLGPIFLASNLAKLYQKIKLLKKKILFIVQNIAKYISEQKYYDYNIYI